MTFRLSDARQRYRQRLERLRARQAGYTSDLQGYSPSNRHLQLACVLEPEFLCSYTDTIQHHAAGLAAEAQQYVPTIEQYTVEYRLAVRPRGRSVAFDRLMAADLDVNRLDAELDHIAFLYGTPPEDAEVLLARVSGEEFGPDLTEHTISPDCEQVGDSLAPWLKKAAVLPAQLNALREVGLYNAVFSGPGELN